MPAPDDEPQFNSDRIKLDIALRYLLDVIDDTIDPMTMDATLRDAIDRARAARRNHGG